MSAAIAGERARLAAGAAEAPLLEDEIAGLRARLATLERSVSWRVTTPLRTARRLVNGRRALLLRLGRRARARLGS